MNPKWFGAKGDGVTDDTLAIQECIDRASESDKVVEFEPGLYMMTSVNIPVGLVIKGTATLKKLPNVGRWSRMFNVLKGSDTDTPVTRFTGLTFDGNRGQQGPYERWELEHAHFIMVSGSKLQPGRVRVKVDNCEFYDCVADAVSIHYNVDAIVSDCIFRDCFRGAVTVTGGNTTVQLNNLNIGGGAHWTGIDLEPDSNGYGSTARVDLQINNLITDGDFDVALRDGGKLQANNIICGDGFGVSVAGGSHALLTNCSLALGRNKSVGNAALVNGSKGGTIRFSNCHFGLTPSVADGKVTGHHCMKARWYRARDGHISFSDCTFDTGIEGDGDRLEEGDYARHLYGTTDAPENNNRVTISNCEFLNYSNIAIKNQYGGDWDIRDCYIEKALTGIYMHTWKHYDYDTYVRGMRYGSGVVNETVIRPGEGSVADIDD